MRTSEAAHPSGSDQLDAAWTQAFDILPEPVWLMEANGLIRQCNQAARKLYSKDLSGKICSEIIHGTKERIPECPCHRLFLSRQSESVDLFLAGRWFSVSVDPVLDPHGEVVGVLHVMRDVTQQKQMAIQLQKANAQLEQQVDRRTRERDSVVHSQQASLEKISQLFKTVTDAILIFGRISVSCKAV